MKRDLYSGVRRKVLRIGTQLELQMNTICENTCSDIRKHEMLKGHLGVTKTRQELSSDQRAQVIHRQGEEKHSRSYKQFITSGVRH